MKASELIKELEQAIFLNGGDIDIAVKNGEYIEFDIRFQIKNSPSINSNKEERYVVLA